MQIVWGQPTHYYINHSFLHLYTPKVKPSKGTDGEGPLQSLGILCSCNLDSIARHGHQDLCVGVGKSTGCHEQPKKQVLFTL